MCEVLTTSCKLCVKQAVGWLVGAVNKGDGGHLLGSERIVSLFILHSSPLLTDGTAINTVYR